MPATPIVLTIATRSNLLSLQDTVSLIGRTQTRLSTGLRVNSPIDNASAFFNAQSLRLRGDDFGSAKDNIGQAISTVKSGLDGLTAVTDVLSQMKALAEKVLSGQGSAAALNTQFNELRAQLDNVVTDSSYQGVNLISGSNTLKVNFNESAAAEQTITGTTNSASGLALNTQSISNASVASDAIAALATALSSVRDRSTTLGSNASFLQVRLDFNTKYINDLKEGADKLTLADSNEEAANLTALQTRQQVGISALALAAQSERSILALFQ
ncbi:MAG: flagellin [Rhodospirillaceae bacterium]|nr:flagellin [Rhodospirillaceae bacterium]